MSHHHYTIPSQQGEQEHHHPFYDGHQNGNGDKLLEDENDHEEDEMEEEEEDFEEPTVDISQFLCIFDSDKQMEEVHQYTTTLLNRSSQQQQQQHDQSSQSSMMPQPYIMMSTSRLKRIFRNLQNVTTSVAYKALSLSLCDDDDENNNDNDENDTFESVHAPELKQWKVYEETVQLRRVFLTDPSHQYTTMTNMMMTNVNTSGGEQAESGEATVVVEERPTKRPKLETCEKNGENFGENDDFLSKMLDEQALSEERLKIRTLIHDYMRYLVEQETTSFDDLELAVIESFKSRPKSSMALFNRALAKNPYALAVYMHCMEPYRQTGQKLDCIKMLRYAKYMNDFEWEQVKSEIDEHVRRMNLWYRRSGSGGERQLLDESSPEIVNNYFYQVLRRERCQFEANHYIYCGLMHFFSDGDVSEMLQLFERTIQTDPCSIYGYCNLGVMKGFNYEGSPDICREGIRLLQYSIDMCTIRDKIIIQSFLHHTIAQIHMRLGEMDEAFDATQYSLAANPEMNLAYLDRNAIFKVKQKWREALLDNNILISMDAEKPFERSNIYCNRALILNRLGQKEEMREALIKSLEIDPGNSFAFAMLLKQTLIDRDIDTFEQLRAAVDPKDQLHIQLYLKHVSDSYEMLQKFPQAQQVKNLLTSFNNSYARAE